MKPILKPWAKYFVILEMVRSNSVKAFISTVTSTDNNCNGLYFNIENISEGSISIHGMSTMLYDGKANGQGTALLRVFTAPQSYHDIKHNQNSWNQISFKNFQKNATFQMVEIDFSQDVVIQSGSLQGFYIHCNHEFYMTSYDSYSKNSLFPHPVIRLSNGYQHHDTNVFVGHNASHSSGYTFVGALTYSMQ